MKLFRNILVLLILGFAEMGFGGEKTKVVFVSGKPSHGPMKHEHRAGNMLLAKALNGANLNIEAHVLPENGFPSDPSVLRDAATIVLFCTGHQGHLVNPHLEDFDALMKKGVGVVMIHWATEATKGEAGEKFLEWMGGFCDLDWSVNPHWEAHFTELPDHPICNGVKPFRLNDEWYYHMRFVDDKKGLTPILAALPGPKTLSRRDGARSGNPHVRKSVAAGEKQTVAWAYERPGKGRGFGFTGGHNHVSWLDDNFRTVVLNAILWTANVDVPRDGVPSTTPTDEEINSNLDDRNPKKRPAPKTPTAKKVTDPLVLLVNALGSSQNPDVQAALMSGMLEGLAGQRNLSPPQGWQPVSRKLLVSGHADVIRLTRELAQVFGDQSAITYTLDVLKNKKAPLPLRRAALSSLVAQRNPELAPILTDLLNEPELRIDAVRAYGKIQAASTADILLKNYSSFDAATKRAVVETLSTRKEYALACVNALKEGLISRKEVPAYVARSLSGMLGSQFKVVYGEIQAQSEDKTQAIEKYKGWYRDSLIAKADPSRGRAVFKANCAACHTMYGEGGTLGPDITGSNRADPDYILTNIIDPSYDVPEGYRLVMVTTRDNQVLAGNVIEENDQKLVLGMVGTTSTVQKSDIQKRDVLEQSLMPEGLLSNLSSKDIKALLKYLQTEKQVELP